MDAVATPEVVYPDSDGERMAENDLQFRWIVTLQGGLDALFRADPNVIVKGDMLWYPVEGRPDLRVAPDAMVVFGRPKGYRGSYRQWVEGGVAPQAVFEVLSPGNRAGEMRLKHAFYEKYGVEEYYVYDPDRVTLLGYRRDAKGKLAPLSEMDGYVSPRLGVRFELADELVVYRPDGKSFLTYLELVEQNEAQRTEAARERRDAVEAYAKLVEQADARQAEADRERGRADRERQKADARQAEADREREATRRERQKAEAERALAQAERDRAEALRRANDALRAKLRAAGIDPDAV